MAKWNIGLQGMAGSVAREALKSGRMGLFLEKQGISYEIEDGSRRATDIRPEAKKTHLVFQLPDEEGKMKIEKGDLKNLDAVIDGSGDAKKINVPLSVSINGNAQDMSGEFVTANEEILRLILQAAMEFGPLKERLKIKENPNESKPGSGGTNLAA